MVCTQRQAGDSTPVAKGQPMVIIEPGRLPVLAPPYGPAIASGLTKPSAGRFCLRSSPALGFAKTAVLFPGVVAVLLVLASCAGLQAPAPVRRPAVPRTWEVPVSVLSVPVRMPLAQVKAWTEAAVPQTLKGEGSGQRTLTAWFLKHDWHYWWNYELKRSPLSLTFQKSTIRVGAALTGELSARWDTLPGEITSEVEAEAGVETNLSLGEDWRVKTESSVFLDVRRADVPIGIAWDGNFFGETVSIAGPVREALQPSLVLLSQELDRRTAAWDMKPVVQAAWNELQEPRALEGAPGLWFRLGPRSVAAGPVTAGNGFVEIPLNLTVYPSMTSGSRPEAEARPLPTASEYVAAEPRFVFNLPVSLGWDEAVRLSQDRWQQKISWEVGNGAKIRITGLEVFTDADRVLLKIIAQLSPPWPGPEVAAVLWLGAQPVWDPVGRTLKLTRTALDLQTQDYLTSAASWMLSSAWMASLERALIWDLGPGLDQLQDRASRSLRHLELGPRLVLDARLDRLDVVDFTLTDGGFEVLSRVTGTAAVTVTP